MKMIINTMIKSIFLEKICTNKNNVDLIINGIKNELVKEFKLEYDENKIQMIIKNKIYNLEKMFYQCEKLKSIEGLKYLDTKEISNFSGIFYGSHILSALKPI